MRRRGVGEERRGEEEREGRGGGMRRGREEDMRRGGVVKRG